MTPQESALARELSQVHALADELGVMDADQARYGEGSLNVDVALIAVESLEGTVERIRRMLEQRS